MKIESGQNSRQKDSGAHEEKEGNRLKRLDCWEGFGKTTVGSDNEKR